MQFRDIPYLWRRDKPDCVSTHTLRESWYVSQDMFYLKIKKMTSPFFCPGGVVRYLYCIHFSGSGSWIGCWPQRGTAECRPQNSIVTIWTLTLLLTPSLFCFAQKGSLGADYATYISLMSFFSPRCSVLANIRGTDIYKDRKDYTDVSCAFNQVFSAINGKDTKDYLDIMVVLVLRFTSLKE